MFTKTIITTTIFSSQTTTSTVLQAITPSHLICQLSTTAITMSTLSNAVNPTQTPTPEEAYIYIMFLLSVTFGSNTYNNSWVVLSDEMKNNTKDNITQCQAFSDYLAWWSDPTSPPIQFSEVNNGTYPVTDDSADPVMLNATINGYKDCEYVRSASSEDDDYGILICDNDGWDSGCEIDTMPRYDCPELEGKSEQITWFPKIKCQWRFDAPELPDLGLASIFLG